MDCIDFEFEEFFIPEAIGLFLERFDFVGCPFKKAG
jgi:hypothetical protein